MSTNPNELTPRQVDAIFAALTGPLEPPQTQAHQAQAPDQRDRIIDSQRNQIEDLQQDVDQLREQLAGMEALDEQLDKALREIKDLPADRRTRSSRTEPTE